MARVFKSVAALNIQIANDMSTYKGNLEQAHKEAVRRIYGLTILALSGKIPTKAFIAAGHPLGRGASSKAVVKLVRRSIAIPAFPINEQTGRLKRSGSISYMGQGVYRISFTARHARYVLGVGGTRRMVDRKMYGPTGHLSKNWKALQHGIRMAIRSGHIR